MADAEPAPPRVSAFRHLVVVGFLLTLTALIVRTHVRVDDRWGFSMFRDVTMVTLSYAWVYPDGRTRAVNLDKVLYGDARMMGNRRRPLDWILGIGAYRDMAEQVTRHLGGEALPEGAVAAEATIRWQPWGRGPWQEEVYRWPP